MTRIVTLIAFGLIGLVALSGCRVEGEVGDTASSISIPK